MDHLTYTELFRQAARRHVALRHTDTEMHFGRMILTGWPLTKLDFQEFVGAAKDKLRLPILLLESYDARYVDTGADNIRKQCTGAFIVLDKPTSALYDARDEVIDKCEGIGEDVLAYAMNYYRKKNIKFDANTITSEKVGPIENNFWGVRFNFQLPEQANYPLAYQADKFPL